MNWWNFGRLNSSSIESIWQRCNFGSIRSDFSSFRCWKCQLLTVEWIRTFKNGTNWLKAWKMEQCNGEYEPIVTCFRTDQSNWRTETTKKNVLIMKLIDNWFKCDFLFSWFAFNGDGRRGWATASMTSTTSSTSKCPHCWKPTTTTTVSTPTIGPTPNSPVSFVNELMTWINAH